MADTAEGEAVACLRARVIRLAHQIESGISCADDLIVEAQDLLDMAVQLSEFLDVDCCIDRCTEALLSLRAGNVAKNADGSTDVSDHFSHRNRTFVRGTIGRPMYEISEEFLEFMITANFTIPRIADFFWCQPKFLNGGWKNRTWVCHHATLLHLSMN